MIRVLFVCLGNICRSPMAEAVFRHRVKLAGLEDQIEADSAGTGDWHVGEPPHHGTARLLADNQIEYDHCARQLTARDLNHFDYIITMDEANRRGVGRLGKGRARVAALLDYAPHARVAEVPDPYYTGNFEEVYHLVSQAADGLLAAIREEHGL
ncbi:MAG: low molecular weight phosphotyrosine protein phosphatase [Armatimonadetes bacterium]|nr:low molecular weight phosphotyrosine protein phosphatase [Armatimonadota bacterium]